MRRVIIRILPNALLSPQSLYLSCNLRVRKVGEMIF